MSFKIIVVFSILVGSFNLSGQSSCPCCTEDHRMFDFWLGDWTVYDTANNIIGYNKILKLEDGCILNENWKSPTGNTGSSFNYYNTTDSTWNQVWVDNSGSSLVLKGKASPNKMIMESTPQTSSNGSKYKN